MGSLMGRLMLATLRRVVNLLFIIPSFVRIHNPFRTKFLRTASFAEHPSADFAVVAIFACNGMSRSVRTLIAGLSHNRVNVVLVSNGPLPATDREWLSGQVATLIERDNLGRDFGAYQAGIRHLQERGKLADCRKLLLINDSVFYAASVDRLIAEVIANPAPFIGLFEIFEHHYHVSSFFLCLSQAVALHSEFQRFWRRYKPYSTRHHVIFAGEARLTALLMKLNFTPHIIYSSSAAQAALLAAVDADPEKDSLRFLTHMPEPWVIPLLSRYESLAGKAASSETRTLALHVIAAFIREAEAKNQTHGLALCANRLLGAPVIKRDLCYRGFWSIAALLHLIDGFDEAERAEMLMDLRRRGKSPAHPGIERFLYLIDA